MKRKPHTYTSGWEDNYTINAINCRDENEALCMMLKDWDEKDIYERPIFNIENIRKYNFFFCRKCGLYSQDNICEECERNLQGRLHTIYSIDLELKPNE